VDTYSFTAARAGPLRLLSSNKAAQAAALQVPQILNHAHAVFRTVSLIQATKTLTREVRAVGAKASPPRLALLDFAGNACFALPAIIAPATWASIPAA